MRIKVFAMRIVGIIAVSAVIAIASIPKVAAQSTYCLPLQMELAELEKSGRGAAGDDRAIRQELNRARAEERRAGCRSFFQSRNSRSRCRSIRSRISSLERSLSGSRFGGFFGFGRSPVERRRAGIREALRRNGCSTYARSFRTICVRMCDGYYYPLSNTSSRQRFPQDAEKCMGQYASGQAELFYHPYPNGDPSQAVSLSGERYFEQPYAFAFRSRYMPHCAAQLHDGLTALKERVFAAVPSLLDGELEVATLGEQFEDAAEARMQVLSVPIPIARLESSSDPETLANRSGAFVPTPLAAPRTEITLVGKASRSVGEPYYFVEANPGPPATIAGYKPPELKDFRVPRQSSMLPVTR